MAAHRAGGGAILAASHQPLALDGARIGRRSDDRGSILRELRLAAAGGAALLPLVFFLLVATLFPFAVGPDGPCSPAPAAAPCGWRPCSPPCSRSTGWSSPTAPRACSTSSSSRASARRASPFAKLAGHWLSFGPPLMLAAIPAAALDEAAARGAGPARARPADRHARPRRADPRRRRADRRACAAAARSPACCCCRSRCRC